MMRTQKILVVSAWIVTVSHFLAASVQTTPTNPLREFVANYCVTCHNERLKTGNLTLDNADAEHVFNAAEKWEKVVIKLRSRSMPPAGNRRPECHL